MTDWSTMKKLIWLRIIKGGGSALRTVTGALIHVTNALALPAESLSVNVEPIQAGSGDPSPDNVRPISGRTSATVTRTGRNLLDDSDMQILTTQLRIARDEGLGGNPFLLKGGCTYTLSCNSSKPASAIYLIKPYTSVSQAIAFRFNSRSITYAPEEDIEVGCVLDWSNGRPEDATHLMLEVGSTATAYEPYHGNTYTIQLGDTVYGGTLDVTAGKMVVDRAIVDLGTLTWSRGGTNTAGIYRFSSNIPTVIAESGSAIPRMLCSQYATVSPNKTFQRVNGVSNNLNIAQVMVFDDAYSNGDVAAFKAAMSGVQLCYELATPLEITLTPTQIDMSLGENNLWADAGDSTLTYYADGNASTSEALGILLGGTYNNHGGADDVSDDEALEILLGGS